MPLPELWIDPQEKSGIIDRIEELSDFFPRFKVKELRVHDEDLDKWIKIADYTNEFYSFIVERKVIHTQKKDKYGNLKQGDFHTSLVSGRLQDQAAKMNIYFEGPKYILCEGYLVNYAYMHSRTRNKAYSYVGKLANMNIGFNECYDQDELLEKLYWINKESGKESMVRTDIKTEGRFIIPELVSISKIPGVGMGRAKKLFNYCGSISNIIYYSETPKWLADNIKGIGIKSAQAIHDWAHNEIVIDFDNEEELNANKP